MTQTQAAGVATATATFLGERENQRAVDRIEEAERSAPHCGCGSHMVAVAHDGAVWLECAGKSRASSGLGGRLARLTAWSHSRSRIMELPIG